MGVHPLLGTHTHGSCQFGCPESWARALAGLGGKALPKVVQGRGRKAPPPAAEPQGRDGDGSVPGRAVLGMSDPQSASHDTSSHKSNSKQQ